MNNDSGKSSLVIVPRTTNGICIDCMYYVTDDRWIEIGVLTNNGLNMCYPYKVLGSTVDVMAEIITTVVYMRMKK